MLYGIFSQRQMYVEGDVYFRKDYLTERTHMREVVNGVYGNSEEAIITAAEEGVNYIIQTKWITPEFFPSASLAKLVYESESLRVFEIGR